MAPDSSSVDLVDLVAAGPPYPGPDEPTDRPRESHAGYTERHRLRHAERSTPGGKPSASGSTSG